jgi:hypothetical protein
MFVNVKFAWEICVWIWVHECEYAVKGEKNRKEKGKRNGGGQRLGVLVPGVLLGTNAAPPTEETIPVLHPIFKG